MHLQQRSCIDAHYHGRSIIAEQWISGSTKPIMNLYTVL